MLSAIVTSRRYSRNCLVCHTAVSVVQLRFRFIKALIAAVVLGSPDSHSRCPVSAMLGESTQISLDAGHGNKAGMGGRR